MIRGKQRVLTNAEIAMICELFIIQMPIKQIALTTGVDYGRTLTIISNNYLPIFKNPVTITVQSAINKEELGGDRQAA